MNGGDGFIPRGGHTRFAVYSAMLFQIMRDYNIPDFRSLEAWEIRFFYDGLRAELKATTKR